MQFHEKLDFLMTITNTSNSFLAQKVNLDPSHISRIRRGLRSTPKNEFVIRKITDILVGRCESEYQRKILFDAVKIDYCISNSELITDMTLTWFIDKNIEQNNKNHDVFGYLNSEHTIPNEAEHLKEEYNYNPNNNISVYYGLDGKRKATLLFLNNILAHHKPQTVLLYSNEAVDWLTEETAIAKKILDLIMQILLKGNKITIIHSVSRDLDEILNLIRHWLPFYMTGQVEPYYYPKKRDRVFKQTMFISPGVSAVISSSFNQHNLNSPNLLINDYQIIKAYTEDFVHFLNQCQPLVQVYTIKERVPYLAYLQEFEEERRNSLIKTESLSMVTMSEEIISRIINRLGINADSLIKYQKDRILNFYNLLEENIFYEIIPIHDVDLIANHKIKLPFSEIMYSQPIFYTKDEYVNHLKHILFLLKKYDNFFIKLFENQSRSNYTMIVKEELGVIAARTDTPPLAFMGDETNLTAGCWDYLKDIVNRKLPMHMQKEKEMQRLKEYISKIEEV